MKIKNEMSLDFRGHFWLSEFNDLQKRAAKRKEELCKELSKKDGEQEDILHYLEFKKCDAVITSKLVKKLKEIRKERRLIKEELEAVQRITQGINERKEKSKDYKFRTNVVMEILEGYINEGE